MKRTKRATKKTSSAQRHKRSRNARLKEEEEEEEEEKEESMDLERILPDQEDNSTAAPQKRSKTDVETMEDVTTTTDDDTITRLTMTQAFIDMYLVRRAGGKAHLSICNDDIITPRSDSERCTNFFVSRSPTVLAQGIFFRAEAPEPTNTFHAHALIIDEKSRGFTPRLFYIPAHDAPLFLTPAQQGFFCGAKNAHDAITKMGFALSKKRGAAAVITHAQDTQSVVEITWDNFSNTGRTDLEGCTG